MPSTSQSHPETGTSDAPTSKASWTPLVVICLAMAVEAYDATNLPVAISAIVRELATSISGIQAAIVLFSLICAPLMLAAGTLGDLWGKRRAFRIGILLFGLGALTTALAPNYTVFVSGYSVLKATGAVLLVPTGTALILANYSGHQRALAFGIMAASLSGTIAFTPLLMGFITTQFGWRWGLGLSAALATVVLGLSGLLRETDRREGSVDWFGAVLALAGLGAIGLGCTAAGRYGWWDARRPFVLGDHEIAPMGLSITPLLIGIGVVVMVAFFNWGERRQRLGRLPLVRASLFGSGTFRVGLVVGALQMLATAALVFVIPVFLQSAAGFDAFHTGLALLPYSLSILVTSIAAGHAVRWIPSKYLVQVALCLMVCGLFYLAATIHAEITIRELLAPLILCGLGAGTAASQLPNLTLSAVRGREVGEASGVMESLNELAAGCGTAIIGSILLVSTYTGIIDGVLRAEGAQISVAERQQMILELEDAVTSFTPEEELEFIRQLPPETQTALEHVVPEADVRAMTNSLATVLLIVLAALLASAFLSRNPDQVAGAPEPRESGRQQRAGPAG